MPTENTNPAVLATELSSALKDFHRALIRAEVGDDPALQNPYTMLFALIGDPRFAWMGGLSGLITRIDATVSDKTTEAGEIARLLPEWREEAAALLGEGAGEAEPEFRLRHLTALQKEPEVGLATGRLRKVLAAARAKPAGPR